MQSEPTVSIVILNYNGGAWIPRCFESIRNQTAFDRIELIFADNASTDGSIEMAAGLLKSWPNAITVPHGANLGFCEGNNRAALRASGEYLFFQNGDTWLEPDCIERLIRDSEGRDLTAATPLMLEYSNNDIQSPGGSGFDLFGLMSLEPCHPHQEAREVFVAGGCSFFVRRKVFEELGGFDKEFFMYAEEYDLSWRIWATGGRIGLIPEARLHHRGAANENPAGGSQVVEIRTSDRKRYFTNRNGLVLVLKNAQHILLLLVPLQLLMLAAEAFVSLLLFRTWSFVRNAYWNALRDAWRLRGHVASQRRRIANLRKRGDWRMLRFLRLRFNRWDEFCRVRRLGLPKVGR